MIHPIALSILLLFQISSPLFTGDGDSSAIVELDGDRLIVNAEQVPLGDILDGIGEKGRMEIVGLESRRDEEAENLVCGEFDR